MNTPSPSLIATVFWGLLALSVLLTVIALPLGSWRLLLPAAACSLACAVAAIFSIGMYILLLTIFQLIMVTVLYRGERSSRARM